jgi:hypothetical protein
MSYFARQVVPVVFGAINKFLDARDIRATWQFLLSPRPELGIACAGEQSPVRLASKSKCLAESNKHLDGSNATKKCSALRDAEREETNSNFEPLCQLAPVVNGWGFFRRSRYSWTNRRIGRPVRFEG